MLSLVLAIVVKPNRIFYPPALSYHLYPAPGPASTHLHQLNMVLHLQLLLCFVDDVPLPELGINMILCLISTFPSIESHLCCQTESPAKRTGVVDEPEEHIDIHV